MQYNIITIGAATTVIMSVTRIPIKSIRLVLYDIVFIVVRVACKIFFLYFRASFSFTLTQANLFFSILF